MGIIKAAIQSVTSSLSDQWLEVIEPANMGAQTLMTPGVMQSRKSQNRKGTKNVITDGSVIHVYDNQFMILTDGGKIIDYSAEPGYYTVDNSSAPSLFNGDFSEALEDTFERLKYGGTTFQNQKVYYLNLQEIKGVKFGTSSPLNYFDNFYNAELFLRAYGTYSMRIVEPLKFYAEVIPRNKDQVEVTDVNMQFLSEFLEALQASINQMSADGVRISYVSSKSRELSQLMSTTLDDTWKQLRGMEVVSVGIANISYDEESKKLINMRNEGAMLSDPTVREGYVQGAVARGMEAAGSNANGAMAGFMGVNMAMQSGGGVIGAASASNQQQISQQQAARQAENSWTCSCGALNSGKFCCECGLPKPMLNSWICSCGATNSGKFCSECGSPKPASDEWTCSCGSVNKGKFCMECGSPRP